MSTVTIHGIPVRFPFEPYDIQKNYMEKVIECLQNRENGVLESPTGTGKTLSLLCASLAWLEVKKAQVQAERIARFTTSLNGGGEDSEATAPTPPGSSLDNLILELNANAGTGGSQSGRAFLGMPTIIYASRTHSQLTQAMQELKRSSYNHMKACVLGSREQMCVHDEVIKEPSNSIKTHLCQLKVKTRSCLFFNRVEKQKDNPVISQLNVVDIEDLVKLGMAHRFCPYYMSRELRQRADIIFMPYNYLLDPGVRKSLSVELRGAVVILDEAHNIEKICEDSASIQIKSTDITLCIEEVTEMMKALSKAPPIDFMDEGTPKDFTPEELCDLKQLLLNFEKTLDGVPMTKTGQEGTSFEGCYIFELLSQSGITDANHGAVSGLIERIIQFLSTISQESNGPFQRRGNGLTTFGELLTLAFGGGTKQEFKDKIKKCYRVHLAEEVSGGKKKFSDNWLSKATAAKCRVLSFWCFSPGFGMSTFMESNIHCVILTSGTLAPLKPLISELELDAAVRIENPHIVKGNQVCVKILTKGPDNEPLNCSYQNRDNPKYLRSLGTVLMNLVRVIPGGVLIFFSSYPFMLKCQQSWQESGVWGGINQQKPIFVEPRDKVSFNTAMRDYYAAIADATSKGAIFMGVCRGKISEGLDFADLNGRAVFIIGLPYPPLLDPKVVLKKRYLDLCNVRQKEFLKGDEWYNLEATRAVNQAVGRVIRHRNDFGSIVLLDSRFTNPRIKNNMSRWLQDHIKTIDNFGTIIRELRSFFITAQSIVPEPVKRFENTTSPPKVVVLDDDENTSSSSSTAVSGLVNVYAKRKALSSTSLNTDNFLKKKKLVIVQPERPEEPTIQTSFKEFFIMVKKVLEPNSYHMFVNSLLTYYRNRTEFEELRKSLDEIFLTRHHLRYIIKGVGSYVREGDRAQFDKYSSQMQL